MKYIKLKDDIREHKKKNRQIHGIPDRSADSRVKPEHPVPNDSGSCTSIASATTEPGKLHAEMSRIPIRTTDHRNNRESSPENLKSQNIANSAVYNGRGQNGLDIYGNSSDFQKARSSDYVIKIAEDELMRISPTPILNTGTDERNGGSPRLTIVREAKEKNAYSPNNLVDGEQISNRNSTSSVSQNAGVHGPMPVNTRAPIQSRQKQRDERGRHLQRMSAIEMQVHPDDLFCKSTPNLNIHSISPYSRIPIPHPPDAANYFPRELIDYAHPTNNPEHNWTRGSETDSGSLTPDYSPPYAQTRATEYPRNRPHHANRYTHRVSLPNRQIKGLSGHYEQLPQDHVHRGQVDGEEVHLVHTHGINVKKNNDVSLHTVVRNPPSMTEVPKMIGGGGEMNGESRTSERFQFKPETPSRTNAWSCMNLTDGYLHPTVHTEMNGTTENRPIHIPVQVHPSAYLQQMYDVNQLSSLPNSTGELNGSNIPVGYDGDKQYVAKYQRPLNPRANERPKSRIEQPHTDSMTYFKLNGYSPKPPYMEMNGEVRHPVYRNNQNHVRANLRARPISEWTDGMQQDDEIAHLHPDSYGRNRPNFRSGFGGDYIRTNAGGSRSATSSSSKSNLVSPVPNGSDFPWSADKLNSPNSPESVKSSKRVLSPLPPINLPPLKSNPVSLHLSQIHSSKIEICWRNKPERERYLDEHVNRLTKHILENYRSMNCIILLSSIFRFRIDDGLGLEYRLREALEIVSPHQARNVEQMARVDWDFIEENLSKQIRSDDARMTQSCYESDGHNNNSLTRHPSDSCLTENAMQFQNWSEAEDHEASNTIEGVVEQLLTCLDDRLAYREQCLELAQQKVGDAEEEKSRIRAKLDELFTLNSSEDTVSVLDASSTQVLLRFDRWHTNMKAVIKLLCQLARRLALLDAQKVILQDDQCPEKPETQESLMTKQAELQSKIKEAQELRTSLENCRLRLLADIPPGLKNTDDGTKLEAAKQNSLKESNSSLNFSESAMQVELPRFLRDRVARHLDYTLYWLVTSQILKTTLRIEQDIRDSIADELQTEALLSPGEQS